MFVLNWLFNLHLSLFSALFLVFPVSTRLIRHSIANGQAFCLVYAIDDIDSYITVKKCFEEIKELRTDFQVSIRGI